MLFVNFNGSIFTANQPHLSISNRSYKWGDGVFETMKMVNREIKLINYHFERLYKSLEALQIVCSISKEGFLHQIQALCQKNQCEDLGRIRLSVCRNDGNGSEYSIEVIPLDKEVNILNESGWTIDICPDVRKAPDNFSHIKSNNYLPYIIVSRFAEAHKLNEALVLNSFGNICDASKTNLFLIKNEVFYTPALEQGGIGGVMRRFLIEELKKQNLEVIEALITESMLLEADEVFMTNAIQGIRWVKQFRQASYKNHLTQELYSKSSL